MVNILVACISIGVLRFAFSIKSESEKHGKVIAILGGVLGLGTSIVKMFFDDNMLCWAVLGVIFTGFLLYGTYAIWLRRSEPEYRKAFYFMLSCLIILALIVAVFAFGGIDVIADFIDNQIIKK